MKFKIIYTDNKIGDGFIGMNFFAAKELGIPYPYSQDTILIYKHMPKGRIKRTIAHEKVEWALMNKKEMKYKKAHRIANKCENF